MSFKDFQLENVKFSISAGDHSAPQLDFNLGDKSLRIRQKWLQVRSVGSFSDATYGQGFFLLFNAEAAISMKDGRKLKNYPLSPCDAYLNSPCLLIQTSKDTSQMLVNKSLFMDSLISVLKKIPDIIDWDSDNLEERTTAKLDAHLKCLDQKNHAQIKERLELIYKYFNLQYFISHPRKCPNGRVTKLGEIMDFA